MAKVTLIYHLF